MTIKQALNLFWSSASTSQWRITLYQGIPVSQICEGLVTVAKSRKSQKGGSACPMSEEHF